MRLKSIKISNYKNIKNTTINFDGPIIAIVAPNNYGKSNLLHAMIFFSNLLSSTSSYRFYLMSNKNNIPLFKSNYCKPFDAELSFETDKYEAVYNCSFKWIINKDKPSIVEELKLRGHKSKKYTLVLSRKDNTGKYASTKLGRCNNIIKLNDSELLISKLNISNSVYYSDVLKDLLNFKVSIDNGVVNDSQITFISPKNTIDVMPLEEAIYKLKRNNQNDFELFKFVLCKLFPEIENIATQKVIINEDDKLEISDEECDNGTIISRVQLKYSKHPFKLSQLSEGFKRIFSFLLHLIQANTYKYNIFAIEEIENTIHPSLLKEFIDVIKSLNTSVQMIITSYSPNIISYINSKNVYIGSIMEDGLATFSNLSKKEITKLDNKAYDNKHLFVEVISKLLANLKKEVSKNE